VVTVFFKTDAADLFDTFIPLGARNRGVLSQKAVTLTVGCEQSPDIKDESFTGNICKKPCDKKLV